MTFPEEIEGFIEPLVALQNLLLRFNNRGVIIGGIASSFIGKVRLTADLDVMMLLPTENIEELMQTCESLGILPRIENAAEFGRKSRVLLLRHSASGTNIDISLGNLPFEEELVARSQLKTIGNVSIRLPTPEDLIIMKAVAHRPKDMQDIQGIVKANPKLDKVRIKYWLRQIAEGLDMPEIWSDVQKILGD